MSANAGAGREAAQMALQFAMVSLSSNPAPTQEDLDKAVDVAMQAMALQFPGIDVERDTLHKQLRSNVSVFVGDPSILGDDTGHIAWLNANRETIEWRFWDAYRRLQLKRDMPLGVVQRLNDVTDDILGLLEWPHRPGAWDRRGMVVGQVQSGKTSNYTGLVAKAADAGYKVIVVLAGVHNSLRSQTQSRLDDGFLGLDSRTQLNSKDRRGLTGVGLLGKHPSALSLTSSDEKGDFSRLVASQVAARIDRSTPPVLLVVKKNASVLRNLIGWLLSIHGQAHPTEGRKVVPDLPLLVIDDEADHASVNTKAVEFDVDDDGKVIDETDPTKINALIRELLFAFEQSAYVGYTATPFANIFIFNEAMSPKYGEDLFPESFILRIPPPSNYMGPAEVFGISAQDDPRGRERPELPIIRSVEDAELWMPAKHKKDYIPGSLPPSLKQAVRTFVLTCAARAARDQRNVHNSMLVHVTRFVDVQAHVAERVGNELSKIQDLLRYGEGDGAPALRNELRELWESDFAPTTAKMPEDPLQTPVTWEQVEKELSGAAARINVRQINGSAGDSLEYSEHAEEGVSVIAIGGDKLSRGLTLEGLSVSYYLRFSKMYDTLMQMGRWFGYRPGYTDLCRLYTTTELQFAYRSITIASEELLAKFDEMAAVGSKPKDFALYVRKSPDGLMVTAPAKMRESITRDLTFSQDISETIVFERSVEDQTFNQHLAEEFLTRQTEEGRLLPEARKGNILWTDVRGGDVAELLKTWRTADAVQKVRGTALCQYLENRLRADELTDWTIALINSGSRSAKRLSFAGHDVGLTVRNPVSAPPELFVIKRLVSGPDEWLDLDEAQLAEALRNTVTHYRAGKSRAKKEPTEPSGLSIRDVRSPRRGLLLLYPLDPDPPAAENTPMLPDDPVGIAGLEGPLMGFAVSFPSSPGAPTISYQVPNRYLQTSFEFDF